MIQEERSIFYLGGGPEGVVLSVIVTKKVSCEHVSNTEWLPTHSCLKLARAIRLSLFFGVSNFCLWC